MPQQIYIVISQTGTILSHILKLITKAEYNHASISLSSDLTTMYSFGRVNPFNPFIGGFVRESPYYGTFKRFSDTKVIVLSAPVSEEKYLTLQRKLNRMFLNREKYHYNYLGLFLAAVHIRYRQKDHYYCSEFVKEILIRLGVQAADKLPPIVKPIHFLELPYVTEKYCGKLANYSAAGKC